MVKEVYSPEADETKKAAKAEKPKPEKTENPKPEKTEEKAAKSTKRPKAKEMEGDYLEFKIPAGVNAYGFIRIPTKPRAFLPFPQQVTLKAKIDIETKSLIISKA